MNQVFLMGNLGDDAELRFTEGGNAVANLRIATTERKQEGDQWVEYPEWHSLVIWGQRAEKVSPHLTKGTKIAIRGRLQTRSWEKDGIKRYKTEVVVQDLEFCGGGEKREEKPPPRQPPSDPPVDDDDIPF